MYKKAKVGNRGDIKGKKAHFRSLTLALIK